MLLSLTVSAFAIGQSSQRYDFTIFGANAGSDVVTFSPYGKFDSTAKFAVGTVTISDHLTGIRIGKKITSYQFVSDHGGVHATMSWDGKTLKFDVPGRKGSVPYDGTALSWFANFHPWILSQLSDIKISGDTKTAKGGIYILESGSVIPGTVQSLPSRSYNYNGKSLTATAMELSIGSIAIDVYFDSNGDFIGEEVKVQHFRTLKQGVTGLFTDPLSKFPELSQATYKTKALTNLSWKTRGGVSLIADAVVPDAPGKFPVILERTPYGRQVAILEGSDYASRGYAFVVQDCRGTGDSQGEWDPFIHEENDGYDAVQSAAAQPWSNGKVGMIGGSYGGSVQWAAAVKRPPALLCIVPQVSPPDAFENLPYEFGTFILWGSLWWANIIPNGQADLTQATKPIAHPEQLMDLPLSVLPEKALGKEVPFFTKWLQRTSYSDWKGFDYEKQLQNVTIPVLNISGWWDGDGIGTDLHWLKMRSAHRKNMWLIEGPWVHAFDTTSKLGEDNYGPTAIIDLDSMYLKWFDHWLKGKSVGLSKIPKVQYFAMVQNQWHKTSDFPDPKAMKSTLYLSDSGSLQSKSGSGKDSYVYDPSKVKIPSEIKNNPMSTDVSIRIHISKAKDHLVFKSAVLTKPMIVEGPYSVDLTFKINTVTTDLYALLADMDGKGNLIPLSVPGKLNLSYLTHFDRPTNLVPGRIYKAHLMPWMSARELKVGHRLVLIVSSQAFPGTARNLNTGEPIATGTKMKTATITIYHDQSHPSSISFYKL